MATAPIENGNEITSPSNGLSKHSEDTIFIPPQFQPKRKIGKRDRWFHANWCDDFS